MRLIAALLLVYVLQCPLAVFAAEPGEVDVYKSAMSMAADKDSMQAVAMLQGAAAVSGDSVWRERMVLAARLIEMRSARSFAIELGGSNHDRLAEGYLRSAPKPVAETSMVPAVLAVFLPGAGHAWLGRWHDAWVASIMVWPMLVLTIWAARRRMGPVTVFFALITAWLWSGTVFSAVSLSERATLEGYMIWWQGLWQASALPGRPW